MADRSNALSPCRRSMRKQTAKIQSGPKKLKQKVTKLKLHNLNCGLLKTTGGRLTKNQLIEIVIFQLIETFIIS
jgi:hypothetical protein